MAVIHSKKMGKRHVYHFVTSPFLLIALSECLGIEDCPISPDTRQRLDSLWSSLSDSPFMVGLTFSIGDRSGLQASRQAHPFYGVERLRNHSCAE